MTEKNIAEKEAQYQFYLEHCVDEDKDEEPLNFKEWIDNHFEENQTFCKVNRINIFESN